MAVTRIATPVLAAFCGLTLGLLVASPAGAQPAPSGADEAAAASEATPPEPAAPADALGRDTPRGTVTGFLEAARAKNWERAARYLNLAPVPAAEREQRGPELARHLKVVLDREHWVEVERLSAQPGGRTDDELAAGRDRFASLETPRGRIDLYVDRVRQDGEHVWTISSTSVARIPYLWEEFGYGPLAAWLPDPLVELQLFEVALWQWAALAVALITSWLLGYLLIVAVVRLLRPVVQRSAMKADDRLLQLLVSPSRLLATVTLFAASTAPLGLSSTARGFLSGAVRAVVIFAITWLLFRLVDFFARGFDARLREQGQLGATAFVPMGSRAIKAALGALALLSTLDTFGFDVTALIAGLGVGGLAVALAAQKTLENVFGGVAVLTDQPVRVGDFCRFGDRVGTVEDIGIRSTRMRTLDRTIVTIPNADFSTIHLENFAKRDRMFLQTKLGLRYETTPEQLRHLIVKLRDVLFAHPKISNDPARVRFVGFGDFSLDLEVFAYAVTADWNEFLGIREDVFLRFMDVVEESGSGFAFPSNTTYLAKDDGLDAERVKAAEAEVAGWRESKQLMLPNHTPERIAELARAGDWPPPGSPG